MLLAAGIAKARTQVQGMGIQEPIASNQTSDGRAKNRRVEIVLFDGGR
jgi:outer membrane protein OmpA-like peptidoglycan-associated protein